MTEKSWVRILRAAPERSVRLVCLPHSGGTAGFFRDWSGPAGPDVELAAVQYPGREDRMGEAPPAELEEAADRISAELAALAPAPLVLFGHSLGAIVAYETALALRARGSEPDGLVVSGSRPPRSAGGGRSHLLPDERLWSELDRLGGVPGGTVLDPELRELFLEVIREDVRLNERYRPRPGTAPLSAPVRCYTGVDDALAPAAALRGWSAVTTGPFSTQVRPGGHFHLTEGVAALVADVVRRGRVQGAGDPAFLPGRRFSTEGARP